MRRLCDLTYVYYEKCRYTIPALPSPLLVTGISFWSCAECISQKKRLGGLLFLLPKILGLDGLKNEGTRCPNNGEGMIKDLLAQLERFLIHENIPVSEMKITSGISSLHQIFQ